MRERREVSSVRLIVAAISAILLSGASAATLDVNGGSLNYTGNGINNFTITSSGVNYSIADTEAITLLPGAIAAGWMGSGTNTVTGPTLSVTNNFTVNLTGSGGSIMINCLINIPGSMTLISGGTISEGGLGIIKA